MMSKIVFFLFIFALSIQLIITKELKKNYLDKWFDQFDLNDDGIIDLNEASDFLPKIEKKLKNSGDNFKNKISEYFKMVDSNSDGQISFSEFSDVVKTKLREFLKNKRENF